jgi:hypothetical protein
MNNSSSAYSGPAKISTAAAMATTATATTAMITKARGDLDFRSEMHGNGKQSGVRSQYALSTESGWT